MGSDRRRSDRGRATVEELPLLRGVPSALDRLTSCQENWLLSCLAKTGMAESLSAAARALSLLPICSYLTAVQVLHTLTSPRSKTEVVQR